MARRARHLRGRNAAVVCGVRGIGRGVREHRVDRRHERCEPNETGENSFIADGVLENEGRTLVDLMRVKLGRACRNPGFHFARFRAGLKFGGLDAGGLGRDGDGFSDAADFPTFAECCVTKGEADFVAIKSKIAAGLGYEIWDFIMPFPVLLVPTRVQHERRIHDGAAAAPIEPIALLA